MESTEERREGKDDGGSDEQNKVGERRAGVGVLEERTRGVAYMYFRYSKRTRLIYIQR